MSPRTPAQRLVSAALMGLLVTGAAGPATSETTIFHTTSCVSGAVSLTHELQTSAPEVLELCMDPGGDTGSISSPCDPSAVPDSETCGLDVEIQVEGDGLITDFIPASGLGIVHSQQVAGFGSGVQSLRFNFVRGVSPAGPGLVPLGSLTVDATGPAGTALQVVAGQRVRLDTGLEEVSPFTVAVTALPEPGGGFGLVFGCAALAALHRRRARR